ncbi:MAG: FtsX-like permease family protein [Luteitalea sp.]|nr:FtsX-like permease family protein [Luteitalea sp.]
MIRRAPGTAGIVAILALEARDVERVLKDIRYAICSLSRSSAFSLAAVLSLALGIGTSVALFSVVNILFFEPLPVRDADHLVALTLGTQKRGQGQWLPLRAGGVFSYPMFERIRTERVLSEVFGFTSTRGAVEFGDEPERLQILEVTDNYYEALGISAAAGRLIGREHAQPANAAVVVLSHRFWQQHFGGQANAIGQVVRVEGLPMTVIGVEPGWFEGLQAGRAPDIIVPVAAEPLLRPTWERLNDRGTVWLRVFAYPKPGMPLEEARAGLQAISPAVMLDVVPASYPAHIRQAFLTERLGAEPASTGVSDLRERFASPLATVIIMVAILLAIAMANVANLFVSRALARRQESAIRLAVGASPRHIVQHFVIESLLLATVATLLGVVVAYWVVEALVALMSVPDAPIRIHFALDGRVLAFAVGLAMAAALILGFAAASRVRSASLSANLQEGSRAGSRSRLRTYIVGVQVALSTLLLVCAGLFVRTLLNLRNVDVGFSPHALILARLDPQRTGLEGARLADMYWQLVSRVGHVPGVRSASLCTHSPLGGDRWNDRVTVDGTSGSTSALVLFSSVGPRYFSTLGTSFVLGRDFSERDSSTAPAVAIVNEVFTRTFFGTRHPVGRAIRVGESSSAQSYEVIGVVKDAKFQNLREEGSPMVYLPFLQRGPMLSGEMTLVVRAESDVSATASVLGRMLRDNTSNVAFHMQTMSAHVDSSLTRERLLASLATAFGVMAVVLAGVGLYGIITHAVVSRTSEIGLHMALGATSGRVVWTLVRGLLVFIGSAVLIGSAAAVMLAGSMRSLLFDVRPADPMTLVSVAGFIILIAIVAGVIPARRATRIDPAVALRHP